MNLAKGHNNLTKLNEKTSCICGEAFQTCSSCGSGWEFSYHWGNFILFLLFSKINTSVSSIT